MSGERRKDGVYAIATPAVAWASYARAAAAPARAARPAAAAAAAAVDASAWSPFAAPVLSGKGGTDDGFSVFGPAGKPPLRARLAPVDGTLEDGDERCVSAFSDQGADGMRVARVAYAQVGDESLLFAGGDGGTVQVRDTRFLGAVRELVGHGNAVSCVVSAGRRAGRADGNVVAASCSWDCTVRLRCESAAAIGEVRALQMLGCSIGEEALLCLDMAPDATRIVAGGRYMNTVHVWTRRRSAGALAVANGADAYGEFALCGHTARVNAVQVSKRGDRIVSASWDRTVRVWRAAGRLSRAGPGRVVAFRARDKSNFAPSLVLAADARTVYAGL